MSLFCKHLFQLFSDKLKLNEYQFSEAPIYITQVYLFDRTFLPLEYSNSNSLQPKIAIMFNPFTISKLNCHIFMSNKNTFLSLDRLGISKDTQHPVNISYNYFFFDLHYNNLKKILPRMPLLTKWTRLKYSSRSFWIGVPDSNIRRSTFSSLRALYVWLSEFFSL